MSSDTAYAALRDAIREETKQEFLGRLRDLRDNATAPVPAEDDPTTREELDNLHGWYLDGIGEAITTIETA